MWAYDTLFHLLGFIEQDGVWRDLAACSGGCGDTDERHATCAQVADAEGFRDALIAAGQGRNELGDIEWRAAAEAYDQVWLEHSSASHGLLEHRYCRLGSDAIVDLRLCKAVKK